MIEGGYVHRIRLIAAENDDVRSRHADEKADVAECRIAAALKHNDCAGGRWVRRCTPVEVGTGAQRACTCDAGALETGTDKGGAPRCLVAVAVVAELVEHRDDAWVVRRSANLGLAKLAPGLGHPGWLLHEDLRCGD